MKEKFKETWFKFLIAIYGIAVLFAILTALATIYALTHPELGLFEKNQFVQSLIANYGLPIGLLFAILYNLVQILFFWPFFAFYRYIDKKNEEFTRGGPLIYSCMAAFGMSHLTLYLLNAVNDLSWVFFHESPIRITLLLDSWSSVFFLEFAVFLVLFVIAYYLLIKKWPSARTY